MILRPPISTRTDTPFPYTSLFRSLASIGAFVGPRGERLFRPKGGWTVRLGGNAAAVALSLGDGTIIPLIKLSGSGSEGLGSAHFELPKASIAALAGKADATIVHIEWQDGDGKWTPFFGLRSEEHPSELQSLMRISYAVFCLKKKNTHTK